MEVVDARARKCNDVTIIIDKKMRQRKLEQDKLKILHAQKFPIFDRL